MGEVCGRQFTEDEGAPSEAPKLVGVREWDASADAEILGGELLEEVADDPDEATQEEPEKGTSRV